LTQSNLKANCSFLTQSNLKANCSNTVFLLIGSPKQVTIYKTCASILAREQ